MATQNERDSYKWWLFLTIISDTLILLLCFSIFFLPIFSCEIGDETKNMSVFSLMLDWLKSFSFSHVTKDATLVFLILAAALLALSIPLLVFIFRSNVKNIFKFLFFNRLTDSEIDSGWENVKIPGFSFTLGIHMDSVLLIGFCSFLQRLYEERFPWSITFINGVTWWIILPAILLIPYTIALIGLKRHYKGCEDCWFQAAGIDPDE